MTMKPLYAFAAATLAALAFNVHAVGRLVDLSIFDRSTGRELPVYWHEGRAYVVGRPGSEYRVVVRSRNAEDLLAVVSVDGVNVMNGETASPRQSGYIVTSWNRVDIGGWRKSLDEIAAFYFTPLGDSYAARTGRPDNVGVIGAAIFERKREEPPAAMMAPPANLQSQSKSESRDAARSSGAPAESASNTAGVTARIAPTPAARLGTGHGRREESRVRWVDFQRASDTPAETIAIYYDSYRNLVARGILQAPAASREPDPFPMAFAPDPSR
jgi:hypothetical protein